MDIPTIEIATCQVCGGRLSRVTGDAWRHNHGLEPHPAEAIPASVRPLRMATNAQPRP
jgi:hypothetical protein